MDYQNRLTAARRAALWAQARERRGRAGWVNRIELEAFDLGTERAVAIQEGPIGQRAPVFAWQGKWPSQALYSAAVLLGVAAVGVLAGAAAAVWGW